MHAVVILFTGYFLEALLQILRWCPENTEFMDMQVLPVYSSQQQETWAWPQVPYNATEASERETSIATQVSEASSSSPACSWVCLGALCACTVIVLCVMGAVGAVLWRRGRKSGSLGFTSHNLLRKPGTSNTSPAATCTIGCEVRSQSGFFEFFYDGVFCLNSNLFDTFCLLSIEICCLWTGFLVSSHQHNPLMF